MQENRYAIVDPSYSQNLIGFIHEKNNVFIRKLMHTRYHFISLIIDAIGNELFRVRVPPWLINRSKSSKARWNMTRVSKLPPRDKEVTTWEQ